MTTLLSRLTAQPYDDEAPGGADESALPTSAAGLIVGLGSFAVLSWLGAVTIAGIAEPVSTILLAFITLFVLLLVPPAVRPARGFGRREISQRASMVQYLVFAVASVAAMTALWLPGSQWAPMALVAVLQTGYTLGVALTALETRLDDRFYNWEPVSD